MGCCYNEGLQQIVPSICSWCYYPSISLSIFIYPTLHLHPQTPSPSPHSSTSSFPPNVYYFYHLVVCLCHVSRYWQNSIILGIVEKVWTWNVWSSISLRVNGKRIWSSHVTSILVLVVIDPSSHSPSPSPPFPAHPSPRFPNHQSPTNSPSPFFFWPLTTPPTSPPHTYTSTLCFSSKSICRIDRIVSRFGRIFWWNCHCCWWWFRRGCWWIRSFIVRRWVGRGCVWWLVFWKRRGFRRIRWFSWFVSRRVGYLLVSVLLVSSYNNSPNAYSDTANAWNNYRSLSESSPPQTLTTYQTHSSQRLGYHSTSVCICSIRWSRSSWRTLRETSFSSPWSRRSLRSRIVGWSISSPRNCRSRRWRPGLGCWRSSRSLGISCPY